MNEYFKRLLNKYSNTISVIMCVFALPIIVATLSGFYFAIGGIFSNHIFSEIMPNISFKENFITGYEYVFPGTSLAVIIVMVINNIRKKNYKFIVLMVCIPLSLVLSWFWGVKAHVAKHRNEMDANLNSAIYFGENYAKLNKTFDSVWNYYKAIILDKYIVIWNDNKGIPEYYNGIAQAYVNEEKLRDAEKYYNKSINMYKKYDPDNQSAIANTQIHAALVTSAMGDNDKTLYYASAASEYYKKHINDEDGYTVATAFIWLANAYYNSTQYNDAIEYFELGVPLYSDSVDWGFGDEGYAKIIAISYKVMALSYKKLNNIEKSDMYDKLYDDYVFYRDFSEEDLDSTINYFHWMSE